MPMVWLLLVITWITVWALFFGAIAIRRAAAPLTLLDDLPGRWVQGPDASAAQGNR